MSNFFYSVVVFCCCCLQWVHSKGHFLWINENLICYSYRTVYQNLFCNFTYWSFSFTGPAECVHNVKWVVWFESWHAVQKWKHLQKRGLKTGKKQYSHTTSLLFFSGKTMVYLLYLIVPMLKIGKYKSQMTGDKRTPNNNGLPMGAVWLHNALEAVTAGQAI